MLPSRFFLLYVSPRTAVATAMLIAGSLAVSGSAFSMPLADGLAVCTAVDAQTAPAITTDGGTGTIIAWQDNRSGSSDIYAQRTNSNTGVFWTADGVPICTAAGTQELTQIVDDGNGGAIIVWQDYRNGNYDIYAQRVNSSGAVQWTADGVPICTAPFEQINLALISDGLGGAIMTWEDNRANVVGCPDIYAQRVNSSGAPLWVANGVSVCNEASAQFGPRLVSDTTGGAFITWSDQRAGDFDIYTQRFASGGAEQWTTNGVATCTMATDQLSPDICSDGAGGVIIAWYDYRSSTDFDIYAQRQGPGGAVVWAVDGVVMNNNTGYDQINPAIVSDGIGGAIVVWQDYITGVTSDIYAQRIASAGAVVWTATGVIICTASGDQTNPQIVTDGNSGAFITWEDYRDIASSDIYAQRIAGNAEINWPATGFVICGAGNSQSYPTMVSDGDIGTIIAWQDYRNGEWDIFAEGLCIYGTGMEDMPAVEVESIQNSPNPFVDMTTISFALTSGSLVNIAVYDISGRLVTTLADGVSLPEGNHEVTWNGSDMNGNSVSAGVYFCRISASETFRQHSIVVVR
jgi:hypothetical protein